MTRENDLAEIERLAFDGVLRERDETAAYLRELESFLRATIAAHGAHPRIVLDLRSIGTDLHSWHTSRAVEVVNAIADAHGVPRPKVQPRVIPHDPENGLPARIVWLDADPKPAEKPAPAASDCPVVPAAPAP